MAGMAAEGREIPIADRELTRGRRGTHSDRAHHHRRWFRAPARCRSETGAPSRPRALAQSGVRGFDRLSAVDAGRRPALRRPRAFAQLGGVRGFDRLPAVDAGRRPALRRPRAFAQLGVRGFDRLPAVDAGRRPALRCRSETGAPPSARFCSVGGTRFRPPPGGRCRSETGAPPSARFCSVGGTRFRPPLGGRCRSETGAPPSARFAQLGVRGFDRLPAVDAGRRPALRRPRAFAQLGYAVSTASRRSMPARRSGRCSSASVLEARFCSVGVRGFDRLPAVDAGRRPALRRPGEVALVQVPLDDARSRCASRILPDAG